MKTGAASQRIPGNEGLTGAEARYQPRRTECRMNVAVLLSRPDRAIKCRVRGHGTWEISPATKVELSAARTKKPRGASQGFRVGLVQAGSVQLTRFQVWPPQNMPPKAQPWTRSVLVPFIAMVES